MPSSMIFAGLVVVWLLILVPAVARRRQEVARPSVAALSGRVLERPPRRRGAAGREREVPRMDEKVDEAVRLDDAEDDRYDEVDDEGWEPPPPRYRPGRGGFDPEAAAVAARARYAFRQRVVLALMVGAFLAAVVACFVVPGLWWPHIAIDVVLVGYLIYLRRQVRLEEAIRERRAARMAGTRRTPAADDPELDGWARRGRDLTSHEAAELEDDELDEDDMLDAEPAEPRPERTDRHRDDEVAAAPEPAPALPKLPPAPPLALPAGTTLVEDDTDNPDHYDLDEGPARADYRRAAGE